MGQQSGTGELLSNIVWSLGSASCLHTPVGEILAAERHQHPASVAAQYDNPQETYNYYYLPFCKPVGAGKAAHKWGGLGEVLEGNQLIDSQLDVKYRCESTDGSTTSSVICHT